MTEDECLVLAEDCGVDCESPLAEKYLIKFATKLREQDAEMIAELQTINQTNTEVETLQNKRIKQLEYDIETWNIYAKEREATIAQQKAKIDHLSQQVVDLGVIVMQSKPR